MDLKTKTKAAQLVTGILSLLILALVAYIVATESFSSCGGYLAWRTLVAFGALAAITHLLVVAFLKDKVL